MNNEGNFLSYKNYFIFDAFLKLYNFIFYSNSIRNIKNSIKNKNNLYILIKNNNEIIKALYVSFEAIQFLFKTLFLQWIIHNVIWNNVKIMLRESSYIFLQKMIILKDLFMIYVL